MCRVVVAPCSPFSVTPQLMRDSAALARRHGVRLHTHLAETLDEEQFCIERFGRRPLELMEDLGWTGDDVWYAHGIHLNDAEVDRVAESKTGIAHCPSSNMRLGAGACRVEDLVRAGARVGLGVDGAASNEDSNLAMEVHQALFLARARAAMRATDAPAALDARGAWRLATQGGAAVPWPRRLRHARGRQVRRRRVLPGRRPRLTPASATRSPAWRWRRRRAPRRWS